MDELISELLKNGPAWALVGAFLWFGFARLWPAVSGTLESIERCLVRVAEAQEKMADCYAQRAQHITDFLAETSIAARTLDNSHEL